MTAGLGYGRRRDRLSRPSTGPTGTNAHRRTPPPPATASTGSSTDPAHLSDVVRFDLPLLGRHPRAARRAPAVPHRHGHAVAGPARRHDDRPGLLRRHRWPRPGAWPARAGTAGRVRRVGRLRRARGKLERGGFDLVYTGHRRAVLAARHPPLGAGRRGAAAPGRPAVHPRGPPGAVGAGRRPRRRPAGPGLRRTSSRRSRWSATKAAPTSRPTPSSRTTPRTSGTTASARSSPRCSRRA